MKHLLLGMMILGGAALMGGCPIYPDQSTYQVCDQCCSSADCGPGYTCTSQGQCVAPPSYDASAGSECGYCPLGTQCTLSGGVLQCLPPASGPDGGVPSADAGTGTPDATPQGDAAQDGSDVAVPSTPCNADSECGGGGKCIDGFCASQSQLCSDGTQCPAAGDACVDGVCVPVCNDGACPTGYQCDFNRGVCSVNPDPNGCSESSQCEGGAICVETRCVAPPASADAGPACAAGLVLVNGGCIPDERATFTCQNDGNLGTLANTCDPSSICLHGNCYAACDADGGGCNAPGESCKSVTVAKGTYNVCATASTLGSECNAATGTYCASPKVCIDGYCR